MDKLIRQINLSTDFLLTLPIGGNEFVNRLTILTAPNISNAILNSDKIYIGQVTLEDILLRPKKGISSSTNLKAKLDISPTSVTINGEIKLSKYYYLIFPFLIISFLIAFVLIIQTSLTAGIIVILQSIIMLTIIYLVFRHAIRKSKILFEKDLQILTNNSH